jgi:hypothetical protein
VFEVGAQRAFDIEVLRDPQHGTAAAVDRAEERVLDGARQLAKQLLDHLAHQIARQLQHLGVHQLLGAHDRLQQRLAGLRAAEGVHVRDHLFQLVAFERVLLDPLDGLLREQLVNEVDPLRHRQLGLALAAGVGAAAALPARAAAPAAHVAARPVLALVEKRERPFALPPFAGQSAQRLLRPLAQHQAPAQHAAAGLVLRAHFAPRSP